MNESSLYEKIKRVAGQVLIDGKPINIMVDDWNRINVRIEKLDPLTDFPIILVVNFANGTLDLNDTTNITDSANVGIAFADISNPFDKHDFDYEKASNVSAIENLKRIAIDFFTKADQSGIISITNVGRYSPFVELLDADLFGILFDVNVQEIEGVCLW